MNREEILRMAREAGIKNDCDGIWCNADQLEHFARLVYESVFRDANMAASATIIDAAVLEEREACAKHAPQDRDGLLLTSGRRRRVSVLHGRAAVESQRPGAESAEIRTKRAKRPL